MQAGSPKEDYAVYDAAVHTVEHRDVYVHVTMALGCLQDPPCGFIQLPLSHSTFSSHCRKSASLPVGK